MRRRKRSTRHEHEPPATFAPEPRILHGREVDGGRLEHDRNARRVERIDSAGLDETDAPAPVLAPYVARIQPPRISDADERAALDRLGIEALFAHGPHGLVANPVMARRDAKLVPATRLRTPHAIHQIRRRSVAVCARSASPAPPTRAWRGDDRSPAFGVEEGHACGGVVSRCFATNAIPIATCLMRSSTTSEPCPAP